MDLTDCHTYYTQQLCHDIFSSGNKVINADLILNVLNNILADTENIYFQYRNLITPTQWNLLKAIALEEKLEQPYAQKFANTHHLGGPANIKISLEALVEKEMVYYNAGVETPYYEVYDKFLKHWLRRK